ncbi:hypothetical protein LINGRAHAP2_LOCUS30919 [Linum grandiflorum]
MRRRTRIERPKSSDSATSQLVADSEARMTSEMVATKLVLGIEDLDRVVNTAIRVSIGVCEL